MINRLIDMEIPPQKKETKSTNIMKTYTMKDYANAFINGMGEIQRRRFKDMLKNGIKCGMSAAVNYGIEYEPFIEEVKKQLEV